MLSVFPCFLSSLTHIVFPVVSCLPQVCRYFLDAIENNKYGWFWVCPGGADVCMYRHALPPGFVLKKDKKKEEKEDEISLEELIENEVRMDDLWFDKRVMQPDWILRYYLHKEPKRPDVSRSLNTPCDWCNPGRCLYSAHPDVCLCPCSAPLWVLMSLGSPWRLSWLGRRGKGRRRLEHLQSFSLACLSRVPMEITSFRTCSSCCTTKSHFFFTLKLIGGQSEGGDGEEEGWLQGWKSTSESLFMFQCSLNDLLIILSCFTESVSVADISTVTEL